MKNKFALLLFAFVVLACGNGKEESTDSASSGPQLSARDQVRLKQYRVQGAKVYATYCSNCHQQDGKGLASLYPPLANSDYLLENLPRAACIIKNGQNKEIVVNGVAYYQMMPANPITNLEIAEVLTYIGNTWGNEAGLIGVKDVDKWLKECEE